MGIRVTKRCVQTRRTHVNLVKYRIKKKDSKTTIVLLYANTHFSH